MHNDASPTYFQHQAISMANTVEYTEILDLVLSSHNFAIKIIKFEVLNSHRMESDHSPSLFHISCSGKIELNALSGKPRLNFAIADWPLYARLLVELANSLTYDELYALSMDELNELVCSHINEVVKKSVPEQEQTSLWYFL